MATIDVPLLNSYVVGVNYDSPGIPNATGATAGIPGTWTPSGCDVPETAQAVIQANPAIVASPATAWTSGQYVQTLAAGAAGRVTWTGTNWVGGAAPLEDEASKTSKKSAPADDDDHDQKSARKK